MNRTATAALIMTILLGSATFAQHTPGQVKVLTAEEYYVIERKNIDQKAKITASSDASVQHAVTSQVAGTIKLMAAKTGDRVVAGQELALFDTKDFELAVERNRAAVEAATATMRQAVADAQRENTLRDKGIASKKSQDDANFELERVRASLVQSELNLQAALLDLERAKIVSPGGGVVIRHDVTEGDRIQPGTLLYSVIDNAKLDIEVILAEHDARRLDHGQTVRLWSPAEPEDIREAVVTRISPEVDSENRAVVAHAEMEVGDSGWIPGEFLLGEIIFLSTKDAVHVTRNSVIFGEDAAHVMAIVDGHAREVPVTIKHMRGNTVIIEGVEPGTVILKRPMDGIEDGTAVKMEP